MDATFALALVPALAVLFFVVMPGLERPPARTPKSRTTRSTSRGPVALRHSEHSLY
jgi:hypothetical protein